MVMEMFYILIKDFVTQIKFSDYTLKFRAFRFMYTLKEKLQAKNRMSEFQISSYIKKFFCIFHFRGFI